MAKNKNKPEAASGDHLKYYCVVFGVLVVVVGVVLIMQRGSLEAYRAANQQARAMLRTSGTTSEGRPRAIGDLAVEVEKFVQGFRASSGDNSVETGISNTKMVTAATKVNMRQTWAGSENDDPNQGKGFRTKYREFKYEDCRLNQFVMLMRNIESWGRYRVYEMRWALADPRINSNAPFNMVSKPSIKVGYRQPLARER